jgi:glycosyltransferase involved in cell wall biosynthesis
VVARSVAPIHGIGGLERSVLDLVRYLSNHDVAVTLITRPPTDAAAEHSAPRALQEAIDPRVTLSFVPYRTFPFAGRRGTTVIDRSTAYPMFGMRAGRAAAALVREGRVDLVHGFGASVLGYARERRRLGAPLVLNPQGMEEFGATDPGRARLKRAAYLPLRKAVLACAAAADCVIATDRALEGAVQSHLRVPAQRVRVIPNALDLSTVDRLAAPGDGAAMRSRANILPDAPVLLSVGRLEANKGFSVLASALGALREHGTVLEGDWRWVIAGDGPYRSSLMRASRAAGIAAHVLFVGRCADRDLHAWYEAATLFVHPTLYEGSSLVTLEAMSHRRAVIASAAGGIPDKVKPGVNGWLVPPGDSSALAAAISGALGDRERLADMGAAGRVIVEQEFSWTAAGAATTRLYEDLLRGGGGDDS